MVFWEQDNLNVWKLEKQKYWNPEKLKYCKPKKLKFETQGTIATEVGIVNVKFVVT